MDKLGKDISNFFGGGSSKPKASGGGGGGGHVLGSTKPTRRTVVFNADALGMTLANECERAVVSQVAPRGAAEKGGVAVGDVVVALADGGETSEFGGTFDDLLNVLRGIGRPLQLVFEAIPVLYCNVVYCNVM